MKKQVRVERYSRGTQYMKFNKLDKLIFYLIIIMWILLTSLKIISYGQSYIFLGFISIFLCITNLLKLYAHIFTNYVNDKYSALEQIHGSVGALKQYIIFSVLFYLVCGLILVYSGYVEGF